MTDQILLTAGEVAGLLKVSKKTLRRMIKQGRFGPDKIQFSNSIRFSWDEVKAWAAHGCPDRDAWFMTPYKKAFMGAGEND